MIKGSVNSIESFGLVDGPGVRCVVFLNGCKLRCKYCHNPEMWQMQEKNYSVAELVQKILRYKPYFQNNGGVTFSGGEPLLQSEFLIEVMKLLKKENDLKVELQKDNYYGEIIERLEEELKKIDEVLGVEIK